MIARGHKGFTVIELGIAVTLTALILYASVQFFASFTTEIARPVIVFGGENFTLAPYIASNDDGVSKTGYYEAIDLHREFTRKVQSSDLVVVFGGANSSVGEPTPPSVLSKSFSSRKLSSLDFVDVSSVMSGPALASYATSNLVYESYGDGSIADSGNFSVITIEGLSEVTSITQVRRITKSRNASGVISDIKYEGKNVALYECILRSREVPDTTWVTQAYRIWVPLDEDNWSIPVGATHHWLRNENNWWDRDEPGGYTLVFPDPYATAIVSQNEDGTTPLPKSRFAFYVPAYP